MTEIWYEAKFRNIDKVEVERATEQSVWIKGGRNARMTDWRSFFPTWDEAHAWLISGAEHEVSEARQTLQYANDRLGNIKGLKHPSEPAE